LSRAPRPPHAVNGLAGIAIVLILLSNAGMFPSDLLGVELFLVVSGFLATRLVLPEALAGRGWAAVGVLSRHRLKYLVVSATATVALSTALVYLVGGLQEARRISTETVPALLHVANWHLLRGDDVTWRQLAVDESGRIDPLGHLWLASIVGQLLLAWPLAFALLCWVARRSPAAVAVLVWTAFGAAAAVAPLLYDGTNGGRLYLGTDAHAVAFLSGAAAACTVGLREAREMRRRRDRSGAGTRAVPMTALAAGALALVVGAGVVAASRPEPWLHRGGLAAVAALAGLLAVVLCQEQGPLARAFSWGPLTELGRLSYPIYLLHLPIYWLLETTKPAIAGYGLLLVGGGLAWLTALIVHYAIAERLRLRTWPARLGLGVVVACGLVASCAVLLPAAVEKRMNPGGRPVALALGDSLAGDLAVALAHHGSDRFGAVDGSAPGCGVMPAELVRSSVGEIRPADPECRDWDRSWRTSIRQAGPRVIVVHLGADAEQRRLGGRWLAPCDRTYRQRYTAELQRAARVWAEEAPQARVLLLNERTVTPAADQAATGCYNAIVRRFAVAQAQVALVDLEGLLCPQRRCADQTTPDGQPLYSGRVHLSRPAMGYVAGWLERAIGPA
jgi:peptidoglycan/LPS O-acetylase OafA/YrhL